MDPFGAMAVVFFRKLVVDKANKTWEKANVLDFQH
jgi:hypothetical protein